MRAAVRQRRVVSEGSCTVGAVGPSLISRAPSHLARGTAHTGGSRREPRPPASRPSRGSCRVAARRQRCAKRRRRSLDRGVLLQATDLGLRMKHSGCTQAVSNRVSCTGPRYASPPVHKQRHLPPPTCSRRAGSTASDAASRQRVSSGTVAMRFLYGTACKEAPWPRYCFVLSVRCG